MAAEAVLDWLLGLAAGGGVFLRLDAADFVSCAMGLTEIRSEQQVEL